jgi:ABC-type antimicrobial peptide transport system permease subunit
MVLPAVRRAIADVAPGVIVTSASPFDSYLAGPLAQPRLNAFLLALFAGAAVLLVAVGLFGVMATMVRQRTREIGVRMALGAEGSDLVGLVMRRALMIVMPGLAIGLLGAIGTDRLLTAMLYEVAPTDGITLIIVGIMILGVAGAASAIPARVATRIDPLVALRSED